MKGMICRGKKMEDDLAGRRDGPCRLVIIVRVWKKN